MRRTLSIVGSVALILAAALYWTIKGPLNQREVTPRPEQTSSPELTEPRLEPIAAEGAERQQAVVLQEGPSESPVLLPREAQDFDESGTLAIRVQSAETGQPVAGVRVLLWPEPEPRAFWNVNGESSTARYGVSPLTNAEGRAWIVAPTDRKFRLKTKADGGEEPANLIVEPLAEGEVREIALLLSSSSDLLFVARVLDDQTGLTVQDARLRIGSPHDIFREGTSDDTILKSDYAQRHNGASDSNSPILVGTDGYVEVRAKSWERTAARVEAPGYAWMPVAVSSGHDSRERAREVRLKRSATIELSIVASGIVNVGALPVEVVASAHDLMESGGEGELNYLIEPVHWRTSTHQFGDCRIDGLPPGVPLSVSVQVPGQEPTRMSETINLQPGEVRTIEISIGSGARVGGRVLLTNGAGAKEAQVWLLPHDSEDWTCLHEFKKDQAKIAQCDDEGRFTFTQVPDGEWLVGIAPDGEFAPAVELVDVRDDTNRTDLQLVARDDMFIRGVTLSPSGNPVFQAQISAFQPESDCGSNAWSTEDGKFILGPLNPGRYYVSASVIKEIGTESLADPKSQVIEAGAGNVVITFAAGGVISGQVVSQASDKGVAASVSLSQLDLPEGASSTRYTTASLDGQFRFAGVPPGSYLLAASTATSEFGAVRDVPIAAGEVRTDLVVVVAPAARLRVRYKGPAMRAQVQVRQDEGEVATAFLERGVQKTLMVPVGTITVGCVEWEDGKSTRLPDHSATTTPGSWTDIEFGSADK